jgi:hypothetical protein
MSDVARLPSGPSITNVSWSAVVAGTALTASVALVLHSFAAAVGLAVSSTAPTWRDVSFALVVLSGVYLIFVALIAYGLGGYVAGRLREPVAGATIDERQFRDGVHGMLVWAISTLLTVLVVAVVTLGASRLAAPSGGDAGSSASIGGENIIALDMDRLFRSDPPAAGDDLEYNRSEAARILLSAAGHAGLTTEDRTHLVRLVAARTGLAAEDAEARVDQIIASAQENISRGRRVGVLLAFMAGAAAILGAAVAWFAAEVGGTHRGETAPALWWPASRHPAVRG